MKADFKTLKVHDIIIAKNSFSNEEVPFLVAKLKVVDVTKHTIMFKNMDTSTNVFWQRRFMLADLEVSTVNSAQITDTRRLSIIEIVSTDRPY